MGAENNLPECLSIPSRYRGDLSDDCVDGKAVGPNVIRGVNGTISYSVCVDNNLYDNQCSAFSSDCLGSD